MIAPLLLTLAGFVLLVGEIFFVSMGIFGLGAAACIVVADVLAAQESSVLLWILIAVQLVGIPLVVKGAFAVLPHLPFGRGMLLAAPAPDPEAGVQRSDHLLGRQGVALTDLRPSGTAAFGDDRRTVVAETGMLPARTPLVVVAVEGYRVVVRPAAGRAP